MKVNYFPKRKNSGIFKFANLIDVWLDHRQLVHSHICLFIQPVMLAYFV